MKPIRISHIVWGQNYIENIDNCLKVGIVIMQCVHICSKFSVKCDASHKNNRKSRLFNA